MRKVLILFLLIANVPAVYAWKPWPLPMDSADNGVDCHRYYGEVAAWASTGKYAPFWLTANTYGLVSNAQFGGLVNAGVRKGNDRDARWWDYSYALTLSGRADSYGVAGSIHEAYGHVRLWCFDVTAGIKPLQFGNQHDLSAGGFLFSRNSPSYPVISVGIDKYTAFPFSYGYLEIKGGLTHGWFLNRIGTKNTLLHHKYIAGRLGGKLPVNISYEFHHVGQWGGVSPVFGPLGTSFSDFMNMFLVRSGGVNNSDKINAYGNHIGSQMVGVDVKFSDWKFNFYWQNIFEDGPIYIIGRTMNAVDGLWGVAIEQKRWRFIHSVLYEFLATTDQSGPIHDVDGVVFGGRDDYFLNSAFSQGWTQGGYTIGTPFITSPIYGQEIYPENNRVFAHNVAVAGNVYGYEYLLRVSHVENYGRYLKPVRGNNTALYLAVQKEVPQWWGLRFKATFAADFGTQFGNSAALMIGVVKCGLINKGK